MFADWVPYDERGAYLLEADAAVMATRRSIETRLAFRSRTLDHFWAGLPTITTAGDELAERIDARGAGIVVPLDDRAALSTAMLDVVRDKKRVAGMAEAARALAAEYHWYDAVAPLRSALTDTQRVVRRRTLSEEHRALAGFSGQGDAAHPDLANHNAVVERLKRTPAYPLMRRARRSRAGIKLWGQVPGERTR
jgi:hypothetical protein